ncbi:MAG: hypothetical protein QOG51_1633 [Verrucomicrobiota bacterium]
MRKFDLALSIGVALLLASCAGEGRDPAGGWSGHEQNRGDRGGTRGGDKNEKPRKEHTVIDSTKPITVEGTIRERPAKPDAPAKPETRQGPEQRGPAGDRSGPGITSVSPQTIKEVEELIANNPFAAPRVIRELELMLVSAHNQNRRADQKYIEAKIQDIRERMRPVPVPPR